MKKQSVQKNIYKVPVGYAYVLADECSLDINLYHDDFTYNETRYVDVKKLEKLGEKSVFLVENPETDPDIADPYAVFICKDDPWIVCENTFVHLFLWNDYQIIDSEEIYRKLGLDDPQVVDKEETTYIFVSSDQALPSQVETGEKIHTPRGDFSVTTLRQEEMENLGYGFHHSSEDGRYLIMGNGIQAYAVKKDSPASSTKHIPLELFAEKFKQEYNFLYETEDGGKSVAGYYDAIKAGETFIHQHHEFVAEFIRYRRDFISSDREIAAFMFALSCFD